MPVNMRELIESVITERGPSYAPELADATSWLDLPESARGAYAGQPIRRVLKAANDNTAWTDGTRVLLIEHGCGVSSSATGNGSWLRPATGTPTTGHSTAWTTSPSGPGSWPGGLSRGEWPVRLVFGQSSPR